MAFKLKAGNSGNPIHKNFSSSFKHGGHNLGKGVAEDTPHYNKEGGAHTGGDFWFEKQGDASGWTQKGGRVETTEVPHTDEGDAYYASLSQSEKDAADQRQRDRSSKFVPLEDAGGSGIQPITPRASTLTSPERGFELQPSTFSIEDYAGGKQEEKEKGDKKTGGNLKYGLKQVGEGIKHGAKQVGTDVGKFIKNIGKGVNKWCDAYGCYEGEMPKSTMETGDDAAFAMTIHTNRMDKLHKMQEAGDSGSGFTKKYGKSTKGRGFTMKYYK